MYNLHTAIYVCTGRLTRRSRTTYTKPHTLRKFVHIRTQNLYNIRKATYIAQICTHTYAKNVQHTQIRIHCAKSYTNVHKCRKTYTKLYTLRKVVYIRTQKMYVGLKNNNRSSLIYKNLKPLYVKITVIM